MGVVVFGILLEVIAGTRAPSAAEAVRLFLTESVGGAGVGLLLGYATFHMLRRVDEYKVEVMLTVALAMVSYALADWCWACRARSRSSSPDC